MYSLVVAQSTGWSDWFQGISPEDRIGLLIVSVGCAVGLILGLAGIVSGTIGSIHRRRMEMDFKRDMIERGMNADDITKIIESATPPEDATQRWIASWAKCKKH
jgi:hypothetical protein